MTAQGTSRAVCAAALAAVLGAAPTARSAPPADLPEGPFPPVQLSARDDGVPVLSGAGAPTMADIWRGRFVDVEPMGDDLRLTVEAAPADG